MEEFRKERRYQINYILTGKRYRNQIIDCMAYLRIDIDSNQNLIVMKCQLKLKKMTTRKIKKKWNLESLWEYKKREKYQVEVTERLAEHEKEKSIQEDWKKMIQAINTAEKK